MANEVLKLVAGENNYRDIKIKLKYVLQWVFIGKFLLLLSQENKVINAQDKEAYFTHCGTEKGRGEDIQSMLEKWIMQTTFNQKLEIFGISWVQNWPWLSCLSISESDVMRREGREVWFCQILFTESANLGENLPSMVWDFWCQNFCCMIFFLKWYHSVGSFE